MRFHVLLNSLFKVLFNFPSRYLSAIGLVPVFSLRWSLPPALGCIPKQPDSEEARSRRVSRRKGPTPALGETTIRRVWALDTGDNRPPIHHISRRPMAGRFGAGLVPLHSPLLRESWLVSFPPLTDMLKFSGYSRLIRGRMCERPTGPLLGSRRWSFPSGRDTKVALSLLAGLCRWSEGRPTLKASDVAQDRRPVRALSPRRFVPEAAHGGERLKSTADERDYARATRQHAAGQAAFYGGSRCDDLFADPRTGVALAVSQSRNVRSRCRCSVCPAIHINSRSWLRSSSTHEPSDPPHRVVSDLNRYRPPAQHGQKSCALAPESSDPETCVQDALNDAFGNYASPWLVKAIGENGGGCPKQDGVRVPRARPAVRR
jgi:hypothetical protein